MFNAPPTVAGRKRVRECIEGGDGDVSLEKEHRVPKVNKEAGIISI